MLRVLGEIRVGETPLRFRSRRAAELLGLLAVGRPEGLLRAEAAAALWPEFDADRAAHNLRQTLVYLRESLSTDPIDRDGDGSDRPCLRTDRERIVIDGPIDAREFLRLVQGGAATWSAAAALDRGDLLPGIEGEWVERARTAHQSARLTLLVGLSTLRREDDPAEALRLARRAVETDPLLEGARRATIEALVTLGERARAVEEFSAYDRQLRSELGLAASPLLRELAFDEEGERLGVEPPLSPGAGLAVAIGTAPRHEAEERYRVGIVALRSALARTRIAGGEAAAPDARAVALGWVSRFEFAVGDWDGAVATARSAEALARGSGPTAFARVQLARALAWTGRAEEARPLAASVLRVAKAGQDLELGAEALLTLGAVAWHEGDLALSGRLYTRAARWAARAGTPVQETRAFLSLAALRLRGKGPEEVEATIAASRRAVESAERSGIASLNAHARGDLARHCEAAGDLESARRGYAAALGATEGGRNPLARSQTLTYMGDLETRLGHPDAARVHHEEAVALRRVAGDRVALATSLRGLGKALLALERLAEARAALQESIRLFEASGATDAPATARLPLALTLLRRDERREAAHQARLALAEREALDPVSREFQVADGSLGDAAIEAFRSEFARAGLPLGAPVFLRGLGDCDARGVYAPDS